MKRASAAVLLTMAVVGVVAASSPAGVHSRLTREQAVKRLRGALGARPTQVRLVWADEALTRVVLEWTAYSAHARIRPGSWPMGAPEPKTYHGPARAWIGAYGGPPAGVGTVRPNAHVRPYSEYISVSLLRAVRSARIQARLAPLRPKPAVGWGVAFEKLTSYFAEIHARPQRLWLVLVKRDHHSRLAWMAVGRGARGPVVGLLDATSGNRIVVMTFHR